MSEARPREAPAAEGGARRESDAGRPDRTAAAVKVLYVAGIGRSGSTLLARALGSVDGLAAGGEVMHFFGRGLTNNELCACGSPVRECPVWGRVAEGMRDGGGPVPGASVERLRHRVTEGRHLPALFSPLRTSRFDERLRDLRNRLGRLYREWRRASGARAVVDSSKNAGYARLLRDAPGVELHLVHLVRDSRGVAHSLGKEKERPGVPWEEGRELLDRRGPAQASLLWSAAQLLVESLGDDAASYRCVRYRDFVRKPRRTLRQLLRGAGEYRGAGQLAHVGPGTIELEPQHVLAGNPVRDRHGTVPLEEDLEWRRRMGAGSRGLVSALTLPLLLRYGYLGRKAPRDGTARSRPPERGPARLGARKRAHEGSDA